jgi:hypothetical protein
MLAALAGPISGRAGAIVVTSPAFVAGGRIPQRYAAASCGGTNLSVPLRWRGIPPFARSLAVSIFDPDARAGSGFWHWLVYDMPPSVRSLPASVDGAGLPEGTEVAKNDAQVKKYHGMCPPRGQLHHYRFTVYALDQAYVQAKRNLGAYVVLQRMTSSILASGTLTGTYGR